MTTEVELLMAAAKAAGIEAEWHHGCGDALHLTAPDATAIYWNPLRDDGQAFRLANSLRLTVYHAELAVIVKHKQYSWEWMGEGVNEDHGDRNASARRAIVRAAAAMAEAPAVSLPNYGNQTGGGRTSSARRLIAGKNDPALIKE